MGFLCMLQLHQMGILTIQFIKTPSTALETAPEHVWKISLMVILTAAIVYPSCIIQLC